VQEGKINRGMKCKQPFYNIRALPKRRLTADKREIKDFRKLLAATSFIRKTLAEIVFRHL